MAEKEKVEATVKEASTSISAGSNNSADIMAIVSLVLGIVSLCGACFWYCAGPISLIGIVMGVMGMKSEKNKTLAIIGVVLAVIGLVASACFGILMLTGNVASWSYNY